MSARQVDLHVDPACPWCWLTALWLYEVERLRPIRVTTRVFSLVEVNRERFDSSEARQGAERALRVLVAARRHGGERAVRDLYRALGEAHHERALPLLAPKTISEALAAAGLDAALAEQSDDVSVRAELAAEHRAAVERGAFGVPTLSVDGCAPVFGPIIDHHVTGEEAGELWDIVMPALTDPRIFELKRTRTGRPQVGRQLAAARTTH